MVEARSNAMGSSMSMVRSSQHSARRSACDGGKAGSRFLKMVLVCSILEMSKAGSGSNSPNSLGVGTRSLGCVHDASPEIKPPVVGVCVGLCLQWRGIQVLGVLGGGVGRCRAGRGGWESRRWRCCGQHGMGGAVVAQDAAVARTVACPDCSSCLCCWCWAVLAPAACTVALRLVSPRLVPPAWRGPLRLVGVPSGSAPGSGTL